MSAKDELLYSALHGTAMRSAAERRNLAESIAGLREIADGHDEVLAEAAGITAGAWYAWPSTHVGHELVDAGMLIMASGHDGNPLDFEALERWTRVGVRAGDAVPQRRTITGECGYAPAQGKEGPHAIAWGLCSVAASCKELERSPRSSGQLLLSV